MSNISDIINGILNDANFQAILVTVITYISTNIVAWMVLIIKYIISENKRNKITEDYDEKLQAITKQYTELAAKYYDDMNDSIKKLEANVSNKVDAIENERKKQIKQQSLDLRKTIDEAKSLLDKEQDK